MQSLSELEEQFALPGVLRFDEPQPGMLRARVTTASCEAELYLQGAHLTGWQPRAAREPGLFLSSRSEFVPGKAIRGGVPVIFPWFGARSPEIAGNVPYDRAAKQASHGFARTSMWTLQFAALAGEDVRLTLTLGPSETSRAAGFDRFRVALEFTLGEVLRMRLTVANDGDVPLVFEQALHSYLRVGDVREVELRGLGSTEFLDKTDGFKRKRQESDVLRLTGETDRPYLNTEAPITVSDVKFACEGRVSKTGSRTTVVWNPWERLAASLADMGEGEWTGFVCVETSNVAEDRVTLAPGETHVMSARVELREVDAGRG